MWPIRPTEAIFGENLHQRSLEFDMENQVELLLPPASHGQL